MTDELKQRKEQIYNFLKLKQNKVIYLLLIFVVWLGTFIRTRNLPFLQKKYVLALDPHVVLRYVNYIVEHGKLFAVDTLRYYPFGYETYKDLGLLSNIIAKMYGFFHIFKPSMTSTEFVIIYPVIMFILIAIFFFLLVKELFDSKKVALFATAFLAVIPAFLYRTMAGFSEKEPMGIFLTIAAFYVFTLATKAKTDKRAIAFGVLSGILTGLLALLWQGVQFVLLIIPIYYFILLITRSYQKREFYIFLSWLIFFFGIFTFKKACLDLGCQIGPVFSIMGSNITFVYFSVLFFAISCLIFEKYKLKEKIKINLPIPILSLLSLVVVGTILIIIFYGPQYIFTKLEAIKQQLLSPIGSGVFEVTVAEAHKPYFTDWLNQFHYFFHLFFVGSIYMFYKLVKKIKQKLLLTIAFTLFLAGFIFSRYSTTSQLNGDNSLSIFIYMLSLLGFVAIILIFYLYTYYKNKESFNLLSKLNNNLIFTLVWFVIMVIGARGVIRLIFVFAPVTAVIAGYLTGEIYKKITSTKIPYKKIIFLILFLIIMISPIQGSFSSSAKSSYNLAKYTGPSFNQQWIMATDWIKQNTPEDAVFAHWWDYGYWVQTGANRATLSDGGNAVGNINHYIGRHVLTAQNPQEALTFLKTYNATNLLIIFDEIGKYGAYSSIGSDKNRDRFTYIPLFFSDENEIQETRDGQTYIFKGTFAIDQDIDYNGMLLTKHNAAIIGFLLQIKQYNDTITIEQPTAIVYNNGQQIQIPLECVNINNNEVNFQKQGLKGCLKIVPVVSNNNQIIPLGLAIYVSEKVRPTLFAQMFLFEKEWPGFTKVYDDTEKGYGLAYYRNYGRLIGSLKIWEVNPPEFVSIDPYYLDLKKTPRDLV